MGKQSIKRIKNGCPNCGRDAHEVWWIENYGMEEKLETHCNQCGWCKGADGEIRNPGREIRGYLHDPRRK